MKRKTKHKSQNVMRFFLLPIATSLYVYGIISITAISAILVVLLFQRNLSIFDNATWDKTIFIVVGALIFFPARKFRNKMLSNQ
ncbi:MAG: hypothetical protein H6635_00800 [Anaerolineales bacterium]|nr:hypothetical protein [Anaerolineales bacterium]MCB9143880.1 hypothetical protein [Anaerolineales bacterium]